MLGKKWEIERETLVLELNDTRQNYNYVCTTLEKSVLRGYIHCSKRKKKRLKGQFALTKVGGKKKKKDKDYPLVAHNASKGGSGFMHSSLLKAIPCRSSTQTKHLGFPFYLWHGTSHIFIFQREGINALKFSDFKGTLGISGFCSSWYFFPFYFSFSSSAASQ